MQNRLFVNSAICILLALVITSAIYIRPILYSGSVTIAPLETIYAIPYPIQDKSTHILESLAHADIFINSPVFGKEIAITITFDPKNSNTIDLGIRNGVFWLGYDKQQLYNKDVDKAGLQTKTLVFPLTASFEDTNQSIDMMLFTDDTMAQWSISDIHARVYPVMPTMSQTKDYIKSLWNREREI